MLGREKIAHFDLDSLAEDIDDFLQRNPDSIDGRALQIRLAIQRKDWAAADVALTRLYKIPGSEQKAMGLDADIKAGFSGLADGVCFGGPSVDALSRAASSAAVELP